MKITLKGDVREFEAPKTALEIAASLSQALKKEALAVKVDGEVQGLTTVIDRDCALEFLTFADEEGRRVYRHTASHVMAQAVKALWPEAKLAIGPAIENGFYYDFDCDTAFSTEDFKKIEKEMERIVKANYPIVRSEKPRAEAIAYMQEKGEPYKVELIEDLPEDAVISFYTQGDFTDLCAGPHLPSTGYVKAVKIMSVAGAYWRGSEKNKMLQRLYATAFPKKADLDAYVQQLEEAKKRDHRRLGRELDLFDVRDEGPGFPFFYPKGMILRNLLEDYWRKIHREHGYEEIKTPMMLNRALWERSGHWDHYAENMYTTKIDDTDFAIKPMNCPGGILVYERRAWSYRDLPIRSGELGLVHRHEKSGTLHGLMRVRCFTQDDAHIFMRPDQIRDEIKGVYQLIDEVYKVFGFQYTVELSTRPENSIGTDEMWALATDGLQGALDDLGVTYTVNEGDGAFYGPKIDFHLRDCLGRTWQCGTVQLDFQLPRNFELEYTAPDGSKQRPIMIHRAGFGSFERFIGMLTEQYEGKFPTWLAPTQVKVLPVSEKSVDYANTVGQALLDAGIRATVDARDEKIGYKIREARSVDRVPYMLILGEQEKEAGNISVRDRSNETHPAELADFIKDITAEIAERRG